MGVPKARLFSLGLLLLLQSCRPLSLHQFSMAPKTKSSTGESDWLDSGLYSIGDAEWCNLEVYFKVGYVVEFCLLEGRGKVLIWKFPQM
jgi:hypothetical protein